MRAIPNGISMIPCCCNPIPFGMIVILYGIEPIPNRISMIPCGSKPIPFGIGTISCSTGKVIYALQMLNNPPFAINKFLILCYTT
jgi:hypothetical protein